MAVCRNNTYKVVKHKTEPETHYFIGTTDGGHVVGIKTNQPADSPELKAVLESIKVK